MFPRHYSAVFSTCSLATRTLAHPAPTSSIGTFELKGCGDVKGTREPATYAPNGQQVKWLVLIIMKDLKLGTSEATVLKDFHPDAKELFDVCCDLRNVCETLKDRTRRFPRQDIKVCPP